jgi:hypothetical protein
LLNLEPTMSGQLEYTAAPDPQTRRQFRRARTLGILAGLLVLLPALFCVFEIYIIFKYDNVMRSPIKFALQTVLSISAAVSAVLLLVSAAPVARGNRKWLTIAQWSAAAVAIATVAELSRFVYGTFLRGTLGELPPLLICFFSLVLLAAIAGVAAFICILRILKLPTGT